ncbi:arrestin domain-containing protein 3-like isoform X6 [Falco biarmicus]|uniref:arrestin domain-containing protein 3-like isoform X6 n=1 Tax=Falco rusticolus TaxID=120794 RepID=UPI001886A621|nr:arrestin domain-containing protein 3-like isoform X6 [Falco rusticolus]XP_055556312.1 arrestin domain-containing protein 3-like isoform X6 [Falco cherrug]XP_055556313.1 arrestin domain-containing protein 3-like isoform X6 [Falco cherrug]XP_056179573.1 arrestin domain-containing protein 3-like isoform X6 [Falco biarmicus]XP_056179574.1 arrestin domain-containing protein 3-like isoform X6 [Falco biarmicus]
MFWLGFFVCTVFWVFCLLVASLGFWCFFVVVVGFFSALEQLILLLSASVDVFPGRAVIAASGALQQYTECDSLLKLPCKCKENLKFWVVLFWVVFFFFVSGESIEIFAEIENCSSRMVVPKATIYQTQAFYARGKMKEVKQLIANLCGESLSSGKTETWNGKQLKIPPVSPSILDCSIIRVEYSLMVYVDIPGAMDLFLNLPLVIGTIPLHPFGSRTSSVSSQGSMNMNWLGLTLPERPEAPPSYAEVVTEENGQSSHAPIAAFDFERALQGQLFAYIQEFRFLPPPLYSEVLCEVPWLLYRAISWSCRLGRLIQTQISPQMRDHLAPLIEGIHKKLT